MFYSSASETEPHPDGAPDGDSAALRSSWVAAVAALLAHPDPSYDDAELLDRITALEKLKSAAAAEQAHASVAFDASQRTDQAKAGVRKEKLGEGVASQIALARRDSPTRGGRHLGMAHALVKEMPHTLNALTTGVLSEWRATLLVRETACLDAENRARVDEALAADPSTLEGLGDKRLIAAAKKEAYRLDPHTVVRRAAKAATERTVTCRPAPDTMTYLTGLLPVAQGVAVQAALTRAADQLRATGDERGRGQIMADTLVDRVTRPAHQRDKKPGAAGRADIEIQLVMTDRALLAGDHEPAHLTGYGTVPAGWARDLLLGPRKTNHAETENGDAAEPISTEADHRGIESDNTHHTGQGRRILNRPTADHAEQDEDETQVWIRRLYTAPSTGQLIGMDSSARIFPQGLRRMIITRDQTCRTPWCDAPIRQIDHILAHGVGGQTSETNGEGQCERCNQAKTAPGYDAKPVPGNRHTVDITTPTGHIYRSTAPPLPGTAPPLSATAKQAQPPPGTALPNEQRPESATSRSANPDDLDQAS